MNIDVKKHLLSFENTYSWLPGYMPYIIEQPWVTEEILLSEITLAIDAHLKSVSAMYTTGLDVDEEGPTETETAFYNTFHFLANIPTSKGDKS